MENIQNLSSLFNYDNKIGIPQKPLKLHNVNDYSNWKARFEKHISYADSSLWIPILEGYKHPTYLFLEETVPKPIFKLDEEEKKVYDREKKAHGSITMYLENESTDELISRFYHLQTELKSYDLKYPADELVEKFLDALPPKFDMYTTLLRENPKFYEMTVEEAVRKSSRRRTCGGNHTSFIASESSQHHQSLSRNTTSASSANQSAIAKIVEDHVALFSSCMLAYENFIGGNLTDLETIEEYFNKVDPDDMEDMDIQWNMAMILRRAKRYLIELAGSSLVGTQMPRSDLTNRKLSATNVKTLDISQGNVRRIKHQLRVSPDRARETAQETIKDSIIRKTAIKVKLSGKIEKLKNSRFVVEHYESVVRYVNGLGLGTNAIPPPVSEKFVNGLIDIDLSCLDESSSQDESSNKDDSSSKADSDSDEFFSNEGSENTNSEGVVSEELIGELKVVKNIVTDRDNCILTEPDTVESNDKLKLMLYGGFKTIKTVPDLDDLADSFASKSREPYKRIHKDKWTCFHYGLVGHILMNCPDKNQGKRPVFHQQVVSPRTPSVKQPQKPKVVKTPVKPMVKPKTPSEAKPSVPKWEKQPAKASVSTSGSTQSGEKLVVKLSKP
ncbi:hypothetical protein L1987_52881 [Smallanthus sonchifolius]|uniref:Uncharacterized protein n=1 Tax=Smallanthus sonchifolius TaxID=185202 RepID=A0ACB9EUQ3_9ASTR|nr:hypothetical protein L1987_52881 [Smallanthus sonchifolius]